MQTLWCYKHRMRLCFCWKGSKTHMVHSRPLFRLGNHPLSSSFRVRAPRKFRVHVSELRLGSRLSNAPLHFNANTNTELSPDILQSGVTLILPDMSFLKVYRRWAFITVGGVSEANVQHFHANSGNEHFSVTDTACKHSRCNTGYYTGRRLSGATHVEKDGWVN